MLSVTLFGSFTARLNKRPISFRTSKVQALLIYLLGEAALEEDSVLEHQREVLMALLWPDLPLKSAQDNLRQTIYQLRKSIPAHKQGAKEIALLISDRQCVKLNPEYPYETDVCAFTLHLAHDNLEAALALYQGEFLSDIFLPDSCEFEEWATARRATFHRQALMALDRLAESSLQTADYDLAEHYARRQLEIDPLSEKALRQVMQSLACSGQRIAALTDFERFEQLLQKELGIALSQETKRLLEQIEAEKIRPAATTEKMISPVFAAEETQETAVFVGREMELAQLAETWQAAQAGQSHLLFVTGGAGRGKTALVAAFARQLLESDEAILVACGHCHAQAGISDPYLPFRQALAQLSGDVLSPASGTLIATGQAQHLWSAMPVTLPVMIDQAPDLINNLLPGNELRQRAATFAAADQNWFRWLSTLLARPYRDQLQQTSLFSQITALLKTIAKNRPLLLVLEDLHWADAASVSLLFHLSREMRESRLLILGTYRPEETIAGANGHPLAGILHELKRQHGDIWLDLGQESAERGRHFIAALLDSEPNDLDESFRETLFAHTGGHALFTVELLRSLQDRGALERDENGRWQVVREIDWVALPPRIEGVVAQRLSRLDDELRAALATAAVEGETFTAEVVAQVQDLEPRQLVRRLGNEVSRQHRLVRERSVAWVGDQRLSRFRFRHQLFQQYLYQSLSEMDLAYSHEEVGLSLERLYGDQTQLIAPRLAWHFEQSGLVDKTLNYLILAARSALQIGISAEAIDYCQRGLKLLQKIPDTEFKTRPELALKATLGSALMVTKGFTDPEVEATFSRARELALQVGEVPERLPIMYGTWNYYLNRSELSVALELAQELIQQAVQTGDPVFSLVAHKALGVTLFFLGRLAEALTILEEVQVFEDDELRGALIALCGYDISVTGPIFMAMALTLLGYVDRGAEACRKAIRAARRLGHPFTVTFGLAMNAIVYELRLDLQAGMTDLEEQIGLAKRHGFALWQLAGELMQLYIKGLESTPAAAIKSSIQVGQMVAVTGVSITSSMALCRMVELCQQAGLPEEGLQYLDALQAYISQSHERFYEAELYRWRGELKSRQRAPDAEITAEFERAIAVAQEMDAKLLELRATIGLGRFWQRQGRGKEARQRLSPLLGWFKEGFDSPDLQAASSLMLELTTQNDKSNT